MARAEPDFSALRSFLPENSFEPVMDLIRAGKIQLTLTRARKSVLGDYRYAEDGRGHRISINANLNKYAFLVTLLHEIAHLHCFATFKNKVQPHGREWQGMYANLLTDFMQRNIFPADIVAALKKSIHSPAASSCADDHLLRALRNYDARSADVSFVEDLPEGSFFRTADGRIFRKEEKLRKRFRCTEAGTKRLYLFSPVYEVVPVENPLSTQTLP